MHYNESDDTDSEDDKQGNDSTTAPSVGRTAPLQSQEKANNGGNEEHCSERVELKNTMTKLERWTRLASGRFKEDEVNYCNNTPHYMSQLDSFVYLTDDAVDITYKVD